MEGWEITFPIIVREKRFMQKKWVEVFEKVIGRKPFAEEFVQEERRLYLRQSNQFALAIDQVPTRNLQDWEPGTGRRVVISTGFGKSARCVWTDHQFLKSWLQKSEFWNR